MADNILPSSPEEEKKKEEELVALKSDLNEIFAECADRQPLKLQESESGQFCNSVNGNNRTRPLSQEASNTQLKDQTVSLAETGVKPCEKTPLIDPKQNLISTLSDTAAASTEQLHADLSSIICELQRIATDDPETKPDNSTFQESAKYVPTETICGKVTENDKIELLNSVMEDLDVMAESIEHDMDDIAKDNDPLSTGVDTTSSENETKAPNNCLETLKNAFTVKTATEFEKLATTDSVDESNGPLNEKESDNQSDHSCLDLESKTALAARKRYASTKSKKVEKKEENRSQDTISTGESTSLKDEPSNETSNNNQSKFMQFFTGKRRKKKDNSKLKKTSSADFDLEINDVEKPLKDSNQCTELSHGTIFPDRFGSNAFKEKENKNSFEVKGRGPDLSAERGSNDSGRRNLAFVESPHVAEIHVQRIDKTAASGACSTGETDEDEVILDMEQLLGKLDLSDKIKRQIRQASQLSFQLQNKTTENRTPRDMKRWKSLDTATYHRATSEPSPTTSNPLRSLRPWKIPMAIKMMKNLRKQQSTIEEDRLSLEFFVPGKKTTIRLHRRTFINFLLKYLIFFFTFIFWIGSLSCISYGAWMLTHKSNIIDNVTDVFLDPYVLLCVVGAVVFIVAFIGCLGALRENIYLLKIFHLSLTFVVVLEVFVGTLVFLFYTMPEFRTAVKVGPEEVLKSAVKRYFDDEIMRDWIDTVQKEFGCCGVSMSNKGYLDWQENQYFNCTDSNPSMHRCSVPLSCCIFEEGDFINYMCGAGIMKEEPTHISHIINTKGCMKSFGEWLAKNDSVIGFAGLGLIGLQILGVVAGRYFIKHLREGDPNRRQSDRIQIGPAEETPAPADA